MHRLAVAICLLGALVFGMVAFSAIMEMEVGLTGLTGGLASLSDAIPMLFMMVLVPILAIGAVMGVVAVLYRG